MREMLVIGIGPGDPDHVTVQAVEALNRAEVFFVVGKGDDKSGLLALRDEICRRHIRDQSGYRIVEIPDPSAGPQGRGLPAGRRGLAREARGAVRGGDARASR